MCALLMLAQWRHWASISSAHMTPAPSHKIALLHPFWDATWSPKKDMKNIIKIDPYRPHFHERLIFNISIFNVFKQNLFLTFNLCTRILYDWRNWTVFKKLCACGFKFYFFNHYTHYWRNFNNIKMFCTRSTSPYNLLMPCEEYTVRRGSLKMVSVDTEGRRSSNWYLIDYKRCGTKVLVNRWLLLDV